MFRATIDNVELLRSSISTIAELIDEGIFKLSKNGIGLTAADRAMVAAVDFNISSSAFEKYEIDEERDIGLNVANLLSVLKRAGGGDKVTLNLQENKLQILIEGASKRRFLVPLIELTQEEVPQTNQLEFSSQAEIKPEILQSGIDDAEIISDAVLLQVSPDKFVMRAEGDVSRAELELEKGNESLMNIVSENEVRSRYPIDYLKKMVKAAKIADSVSLEFGQDYPMKLSFKSGDKASLKFVLAPRVAESD